MPGRDVRGPARRSRMETWNDPTEDRAARYYEPCGTRSGRGSLDRGLSRHEMPTRKRVLNKTPSSTRREGSTSKLRPRTLENQAQGEGRDSGRRKPRTRDKSGGIDIKAETSDIGESSPGGAKSVRSICFPPTPLKGFRASLRIRFTASCPESQAIRPSRQREDEGRGATKRRWRRKFRSL